MRAASGGPRRSARAVGRVRPARAGRRAGRRRAGGPRRLGGDLGPPLARRRRGRRSAPTSPAPPPGATSCRPWPTPTPGIGRITGIAGLPPQSGRAHHRRAGRREPRLASAWRSGSPGRSRSSARMPLVRARVADALRPRPHHLRRRPHSRHRRAGRVLQPVRRLARDAEPAASPPATSTATPRSRPAPRPRSRTATALRDDLFGLLADPLTASPVRAHRHQRRRHRHHRARAQRSRRRSRQRLRRRRLHRALPTLPTDAGDDGRVVLAALGDPSGPIATRTGRDACSPSAATRRPASRSRWWTAGTAARAAAASARRSRAWSGFPPARWRGPTACSPWAPATGRPTSRGASPPTSAADAGVSAAEGMYNRQLAADYLLRVAPPTQPLAGLDRSAPSGAIRATS